METLLGSRHVAAAIPAHTVQVDSDRSRCVGAAENTVIADTTAVVVARCDALSDNQKWVFDVENNLIRYKPDSRFCLRKVHIIMERMSYDW